MQTILEKTMDELSVLRQAVLAMPEQEYAHFAVEAIDFYECELPKITNPLWMLETCGRAVADVRHEVAVLQYGGETPESDAVYEKEDGDLSKLIRMIWVPTHSRKEAMSFLLSMIKKGVRLDAPQPNHVAGEPV